MTPHPDKATLNALADRCEAASGPDRELDTDIAFAFGIAPASARRMRGGWFDDKPTSSPKFTASLDVAMTLVPEGDGIGYSFGDGPWAGPHARIWEISVENTLAGESPIAWEVVSNARTLPNAVVAASLRAHAVGEGE